MVNGRVGLHVLSTPTCTFCRSSVTHFLARSKLEGWVMSKTTTAAAAPR
jgi:hypothetical protein